MSFRILSRRFRVSELATLMRLYNYIVAFAGSMSERSSVHPYPGYEPTIVPIARTTPHTLCPDCVASDSIRFGPGYGWIRSGDYIEHGSKQEHYIAMGRWRRWWWCSESGTHNRRQLEKHTENYDDSSADNNIIIEGRLFYL